MRWFRRVYYLIDIITTNKSIQSLLVSCWMCSVLLPCFMDVLHLHSTWWRYKQRGFIPSFFYTRIYTFLGPPWLEHNEVCRPNIHGNVWNDQITGNIRTPEMEPSEANLCWYLPGICKSDESLWTIYIAPWHISRMENSNRIMHLPGQASWNTSMHDFFSFRLQAPVFMHSHRPYIHAWIMGQVPFVFQRYVEETCIFVSRRW